MLGWVIRPCRVIISPWFNMAADTFTCCLPSVFAQTTVAMHTCRTRLIVRGVMMGNGEYSTRSLENCAPRHFSSASGFYDRQPEKGT